MLKTSLELKYQTVYFWAFVLALLIESLTNSRLYLLLDTFFAIYQSFFRYSRLSCGDAMCTIAASTSFPEPFETPSDRKRLGWVHKQFAGSRHSDHIALLSAYQAWEDAR